MGYGSFHFDGDSGMASSSFFIMAKVDILLPFILSFEGGFSNHPADKGGATNKGVTIATWRQVGYDKDGDGDIDVNDLRLITDKDVRDRVLVPHYWNRWKADFILSQSVANIVVDWVWASGKHGITGVQRLLGVKADGIVGAKTLGALNARDSRELFDAIKAERVKFIRNIVAKNPRQKVFESGWLRRPDTIQYGKLILNTRPTREIGFKDL